MAPLHRRKAESLEQLLPCHGLRRATFVVVPLFPAGRRIASFVEPASMVESGGNQTSAVSVVTTRSPVVNHHFGCAEDVAREPRGVRARLRVSLSFITVVAFAVVLIRPLCSTVMRVQMLLHVGMTVVVPRPAMRGGSNIFILSHSLPFAFTLEFMSVLV